MIQVKRSVLSDVSLFIADLLILLICVGGLYLITLKAGLPFKTSIDNSSLIISKNPQKIRDINSGDEILSVDNHAFTKWEELELYLDGKKIGANVYLELKRNGSNTLASIQLTNYSTLFDLIIISLVGLTFLVMGVFVRFKAPENYSAHIFHWASVGLGMVIVMTAGYYNNQPFGYGHFNRIIWLFAYSITPVLFIHFTASFSEKKVKGIKYILWFFYISALITAIILSYLFLDATLEKSLSSLRNYVAFFDSFFRLFVITSIIIAISICIYVYRSANEIEERKRLQWLLLGFFIGPFSFVIFWVIPIFLTGYSLIPESLLLIFLTAIPITFSIAIIKYRLMDINLIIRRSVVYSIILAAIIIIYAVISSIITLFVSDINPAFPSVLTALAVVALLQPVKNGVQKFVDKKFFRVEYDYREEQKRFLNDIKNIFDIHILAELIVKRVDNLIPVEKIGFFELNNQNGRIRIIANKGWALLQGRSLRFESENLKTDMSLPVAVDNKIEPGLKIESADIKVFKRWGMVLVFPVKSPTGIIHAFLVLGAKKSGARFLKDDIDLLNSVSVASALAIDRLKLQEELILEQLESKRLEELNELKSFLMQMITHELKTPLTSIKLFTEKLQNTEQLDYEKKDFWLKVIDSESDKLRRLIDNILDYARIEKGMKTYNQKPMNLCQVVNKSVESMKYQFMISKQTIEVCIASDEIIINADEDAVERAITNLLTNAIKYSSAESKTILSVRKVKGNALIEVKDHGRGISDEDLKNIFEPFKRGKAVKAKKIEGTGLGLGIVKHIMDAHKGKIEVQSEPGKGSTFSLFFSVEE
jgi:two-component system, OmpR family, phosphate regulon sensor histidine kinase PhoR